MSDWVLVALNAELDGDITMNAKATIQAITDAWSGWIYDHPVSVPQIIQDGINDAFRGWLDKNTDEIIERIADKLAENPIVIENLKDAD